ncbi:MAG: hypothetical protein KME47_21075 [Nodosilinea sp. WJT8-NPBG4]|nr:hypothetical protein [Nodosilinea sp. WJT8-NPBG4]
MSEVEGSNLDFSMEDYEKQIIEFRQRIMEIRRQIGECRKIAKERRGDLQATLERLDQESWKQEQATNEREIAKAKNEISSHKCGLAYIEGFTAGFQTEVLELLPEFFDSFNAK